FRDKYALLLRKAGKNAQRILGNKSSLGDFFSLLAALQSTASAEGATASLIAHHTQVQLSVSSENEPAVLLNGKKATISLAEFIPALWAIPAAHLCDYQPSVAALHTLLLYAVNLIASGAVTPQIVKLDSKQYHVRWLPATLSSEVRSLTEKLEPLLPQGLLLWNEKEPLDENRATGIASVFLSVLLHRLSEEKTGKDIFLDLFFGGVSYAFSAPGEEALSGGISAWLQRYYIAQGKYRLGIVVDEQENGKFRVSVNVGDSENLFTKPALLSDILTLKKYDKIRFEALQSLTQLIAFIPGLERYINAKGKSEIIMGSAEFTPFLMQAIPVIHLLNINVLLPKSLQEILRPRVSVQIRQKNKDNIGFMRMETLLDFEWRVALGNATVSETEFRAILKNSAGLIKYKAQYIYVSSDDLSKLHKHFSSAKTLSPYEMLRTALSSDYYGAKVTLTDEVKKLIKELTRATEVSLPTALIAQLRPYQQRGFEWMYRNAQIGFGSLIADDMGLGKTLQVIAMLLKFKEDGVLKKERALVVAPTGLLANWQAEIEKFAPSLAVKLYHGVKRELEDNSEYDVLLTSYGVARSDALTLKKKKWHAVVIDEAQNIKNYEAAQSKAIKSIPAATFVAMSGTPVENRLSELWSIMDFCNRSFLGSLAEFREAFANPIQNRHDVAAANKLKKVTAPFMMRRLKSDKTIISDLPDKIEIDSFAYLAKAQAGLYEKTLHEAMKSIEAIEKTDSQSLFVRQGLVLQMILALKQICNHPTHFLKNNVLDASLSGKMDLLFEKLSSIVEANEKALIFTQFTEMGSLLQHFITERFGEKPLFYHGGCTLKQRREMVDFFQSNRTDKLFVLSLKAAGTGLNLTAASHVIHYDLWWNPAVEAQATDRAYRIGQKSNVMVHRFITKGTFEERINEMIQRKKDLVNLTVSTGESWIGKLSNKELREIFTLEQA
ncbi:MAG: DEAD/DEAH box helicase, partial [Prevotellaceae bacterium]|nr:DEAD/DEAH box helicase [Prevotellaceae bacterium]